MIRIELSPKEKVIVRLCKEHLLETKFQLVCIDCPNWIECTKEFQNKYNVMPCNIIEKEVGEFYKFESEDE